MLPSVAKSNSPPNVIDSAYHEQFPILAPRPRKGFFKSRSETKRKQAKEMKQKENIPPTPSNTEPEQIAGLSMLPSAQEDSCTPTSFRTYAYEDFPTFTPRPQKSLVKIHSETLHRGPNGEKQTLYGGSTNSYYPEKMTEVQENLSISKFNDKCLQRRILKSENRSKGNIIPCDLCLRTF